MNNLKAGFGRVNINPMMGIEIAGYYQVRKAEGILDDIEINAIALSSGDKKIVLMTIDHCGVKKVLMDKIRAYVAEKTGLPFDAVMMSATHSHTAPCMRPETEDPLELEYIEFVIDEQSIGDD